MPPSFVTVEPEIYDMLLIQETKNAMKQSLVEAPKTEQETPSLTYRPPKTGKPRKEKKPKTALSKEDGSSERRAHSNEKVHGRQQNVLDPVSQDRQTIDERSPQPLAYPAEGSRERQNHSHKSLVPHNYFQDKVPPNHHPRETEPLTEPRRRPTESPAESGRRPTAHSRHEEVPPPMSVVKYQAPEQAQPSRSQVPQPRRNESRPHEDPRDTEPPSQLTSGMNQLTLTREAHRQEAPKRRPGTQVEKRKESGSDKSSGGLFWSRPVLKYNKDARGVKEGRSERR